MLNTKKVSFELGEELGNNWIVTNIYGYDYFIVENKGSGIRIGFVSNSGEGRNYSKIDVVYDKNTEKTYKSSRFFTKYVSLVQGFSNTLYQKYQSSDRTFTYGRD